MWLNFALTLNDTVISGLGGENLSSQLDVCSLSQMIRPASLGKASSRSILDSPGEVLAIYLFALEYAKESTYAQTCCKTV